MKIINEWKSLSKKDKKGLISFVGIISFLVGLGWFVTANSTWIVLLSILFFLTLLSDIKLSISFMTILFGTYFIIYLINRKKNHDTEI